MLCKSILKKKCNESRKKKKKNNYIRLKLDVRLALKKNKSRKAWKYEKKIQKLIINHSQSLILMGFQYSNGIFSKLWFLIKMIQKNLVKIIVIFSSGFKCFKALISCIWSGDFPKSWNNTSIVSIHKKKGDLSNCNNYRCIFTLH